MVDKPVLYVHSTEKKELEISLEIKGELSFSYPILESNDSALISDYDSWVDIKVIVGYNNTINNLRLCA